MGQPANSEETAVVAAFLSRYLVDRAKGVEGQLAAYQALYPGFEDAIAREYELLLGDSDAPAAGDATVGASSQDAELSADTLEQLLALGGEAALRRYGESEEAARGGMARILRVRDRLLQRATAMKVLRTDGDAVHDAQASSRLLEEAQITGQLQHPGIVPVHDLGIDRDGQLYFTMPLIRGRSFKEIIPHVHAGEDGWSLTRGLDVIVKVCEAVAFAHSKGVIHRDLKPGNVMVGRFGEVYVMDWGLARVLDRPERRDIRLRVGTEDLSSIKSVRRELTERDPDSPIVTMDGDVIGTPAYMAPEQARGDVDRVGPRSDVYSVGAMLYHLLSGHMPYVASDSKVSSRTVLARVLDGPPKPVASWRNIPAELVAICEKAMARDPDARYEGMLALAEDLRAYLELRVVSAYRTGAVVELRKWVARNRGLASGSAAALVALIVGLVLTLVQRERAEAQGALAQSNLRLALGAVDRMLSRVGNSTLANIPLMQPVRKDLLRDALEFQLSFLATQGEDPTVRVEVAEAYQRVSSIHAHLGDYVQAREAQHQALERFERLQEEFPDRTDLAASIALSKFNLASYHNVAGEYDQTLALCEASLGPLDAAIGRAADSELHRRYKSDLLGAMANAHKGLGRPEDALHCAEAAAALREELADENPDDLDLRAAAAKQYGVVAHALQMLERFDEAERTYLTAADAMREHGTSSTAHRVFRHEFAVLLNNLAALQITLRRFEDAEKTLTEAVELRRRLARDFPSLPDHHGWLGVVLSNLGQVRHELKQPESARQLFEEAVEAERTALAVVPEHAFFRSCLEAQLFKLCVVLVVSDQHEAAAVRIEELARLPFVDARERWRPALLISACAGAAKTDSVLPKARRRELFETYASRAVELLQEAVTAGFADVDPLKDSGFDAIRDRPEFQKLQEQVAAAAGVDK